MWLAVLLQGLEAGGFPGLATQDPSESRTLGKACILTLNYSPPSKEPLKKNPLAQEKWNSTADNANY